MKIPRIVAILVIAALVIMTAGGCANGQALALEGTIESLSLNPDGTIVAVVDGETIIIDLNTKITGALVPGTVIEIEYEVQDDGSLLALEIEVDINEDVVSSTLEPSDEKVSFRFLISDEVNAIEDFEHFYITISSIGIHQSGEESGWIEHELDPQADLDGDGISGIDLKPLVGLNALEIWSANLAAGEYNKVFIYVEDVTGILAGAGETEVKLPGGKLQISKPFIISDSVIDFVFDITVMKTGNSDKYILKPQITQSGANQKFNKVTPKGKPEKLGKPEDKGRP